MTEYLECELTSTVLSGIIDGKWTEARLYFRSLQGRPKVDFVGEVWIGGIFAVENRMKIYLFYKHPGERIETFGSARL